MRTMSSPNCSNRALFSTITTQLLRLCLVVAAGFIPVAQANDSFKNAITYNAFVLGDFNSESSDIQGRLATGGNLYLRSYGVASSLDTPPESPVLIVGGNVDYNNGQVFTGSIVAAGDISAISSTVINGLEPGATATGSQVLTVDFEQEFIALKELSQTLNSLSDTGIAEYKWGGVYLEGDCESSTQVFHLDAASVLASNHLVLSCVPEASTLLLNLNGLHAGFKNIGLSHLANRATRILLNFPEANTLELTSVGVEGTILAPYAHVQNPTGAINGTVIAASWHGPMEIHHFPYVGNVFTDLQGPDPDVNHAPVFESIPTTTLVAGQPYYYQVLASDEDLDPLVYELNSSSQGMNLTSSNTLEWTPTESQVGEHPVVVTVSDGKETVNQEFTLLVESGNNSPTLEGIPGQLLYEEEVLSVALYADDQDGNALTYSLSQAPEFVSLNGASLTIEPLLGAAGSYPNITVTVSDGDLSVSESFTIEVLKKNRPPIINPIADITIEQGSRLSLRVRAVDPDNDPLSYGLQFAPPGVDICSMSGYVIWPRNMQPGIYPMTATVQDTNGAIASEMFVVTVYALPTNNPPVIYSIPSLTVEVGSTYSYNVAAQDPDGDAIQYSLSAAPAAMQINTASGELAWQPASTDVGTHEVEINVTDPQGAFTSQVFSVGVTARPNNAPIANSQSLSLQEDESLLLTTTGSDVDGDALEYQIETSPINGVLVGELPNVTYQPAPNFTGTDRFSFSVFDGALSSATVFVELQIVPVNDLPTALSKSVSTDEDTPIGVLLEAVDIDNDELEFVITKAPTYGNLSYNGSEVIYTPSLHFNGEDNFNYLANDSAGVSNEATVTLQVLSVNDVPVIVSEPLLYALENSPYAYALEVVDPDSEAYTVAVSSDASGIRYDEQTEGLVWDTPQVGTYTVTITVADELGESDTQQYSLMVLEDAATLTTAGTQLWGMVNFGSAEKLLLFVSAAEGADFNINIAGLEYLSSFTTAPGEVVVLNLTDVFRESYGVARSGVHDYGISITASSPATAYMQSLSEQVSDAVVLFPEASLGKNYRLITWASEMGSGGWSGGNYGGFFGVVAVEDNTTVTITPTAPVISDSTVAGSQYERGIPYTVTLNKGEMYHTRVPELVISGNEANLEAKDLTGTKVVADKKIAVFSGDICASVQANYCDNLWEQLPPISALGMSYPIIPTFGRTGGDTVRVLATQNDTHVLINGEYVSHLDDGEFYEFITADYDHVSSTKPVLVAQFANGVLFDGGYNGQGDPFMLVVPSKQHYVKNYIVSTADADFVHHFIAIHSSQNNIDSILLDGASVSDREWVATSEVNWMSATIEVGASQNYRITSDEPVGVVVYGYDLYESYGYLGGMAFPGEVVVSDVTAATVGELRVGAEYCVEVIAQAGDAFAAQTQVTIYKTVNGYRQADTVLTNPLGQATYCSVASVAGQVDYEIHVGEQVVFESYTILANANTAAAAPVLLTHPVMRAIPGESYQYNVAAADANADALWYELLESPNGMEIDSNTGLITWAAVPGSFESAWVLLQVTDGERSVTQRFLVYAPESAKHYPEITTLPPLGAIAGREYSYQIYVEDADRHYLTKFGDSLTYSIVRGPAGVEIAPLGDDSRGMLTWNIPNGVSGNFEIELEVRDTFGLTDTQIFTLQVEENVAPDIQSTPPSEAIQNHRYEYRVQLSDQNSGESVKVNLISAPAGMGVTTQNNVFWVPSAANIGEHAVIIEATDGYGGVTRQEFSITVVANRAPVFINEAPNQAITGHGYRYNYLIEDPDGDPIYGYPTLVESPEGMRIYDSIYWTPTIEQLGLHDVVLEVSDGFGSITQKSYQINVVENLNPVFSSTPTLYATPGVNGYSYEMLAEDGDGDRVYYRLETGAEYGFNQVGNIIQWSPPVNSAGSYSLTVSARDLFGGITYQAFDVRVAESSLVLVATPEAAVLAVGENYAGQLQVLQLDALPIMYSLTDAPAGMSISNSGGITWQPSDEHSGQAYRVGLQASDTEGNAVSAWLDIEVTQTNTPPEIISTPVYKAYVSEQYEYEIVATDNAPQTLTYSLLEAPAGLTLTGNRLTWSPAALMEPAYVSVAVSDGEYTTTQQYDISVYSASTTLEGVISVSNQFVDPGETVAVQVSAIGNRGHTTYALTMDGNSVNIDGVTRSVELASNQIGRHDLVLTVSDSQGVHSVSTYFAVKDETDTTPPVVSISSPASLSGVTSIADIVGTVTDDNIAEYMVYYVPPNTTDFHIIETGTQNKIEEVLGVFDSTQLVNGQYVIGVQATDINGATSIAGSLVTVTGGFKVGNFTLTLHDLVVELEGVPIVVSRTYDSRKKDKALDFGYGWSADYQNVRVDESTEPTAGWLLENQYLLFNVGGAYPIRSNATCYYPKTYKEVSVTLPDGEVHRFDVVPHIVEGTVTAIADDSCFFTNGRHIGLKFVAKSGTDSTLVSPQAETLYFLNDGEGNGDLVVDFDSSTAVNIQTYELTTKQGYVYTINQARGIQKIATPTGHSIEYTAAGITHSSGKSVRFERNGAGTIEKIIDPAGNEYAYLYDENNDLVEFLTPDALQLRQSDQTVTGSTYAYEYHYLTEIYDALGRSIVKNNYDDNGRLVSQEDNAGNVKVFDHNLAARSSVITNLDGRTTAYNYDDRGNVMEEIVFVTSSLYSEDIVTSYTYDENDNQLTKTLNGQTWLTEYNEHDEVTSACNPLSQCVLYQNYNAYGQEGRIVDERGNAYLMEYDRWGNLVSIQSPEVFDPITGVATSPVARNVFNSYNRLVTTTDLNGLITTYTYYPNNHDNAGQKRTESNPITGTVTFTYDANNNLLTETRERTVNDELIEETVTYQYDARNRVTHTYYPDESYSQTDYDLAGNVDKERDRFGVWTDYTYDAYGRLTYTLYADGSEETRTYTLEGLLETVTDRSNTVMRYEYDDAGRQWKVHNDTLGTYTETQYTLEGWVKYEWDESRNLTEYKYNAAGRREKVIRTTDGVISEHSFTYYPNGELHTETDALIHTTTYVLNSLDQRVETQYHNGTATQTHFNAMGARIRTIDQERRSVYFGLDALGRLESVTPEVEIDGQAVPDTRYTYDEVGNRLTQTDANNHVTIWAYDYYGRVLSRKLPEEMSESFVYIDGEGCSTDAGLNCASATSPRLQIHTDFNGDTITTAFDVMGQVVSVSYSKDGTTEVYDYYSNGQLRTVEDGQGQTIYLYDALGRLKTKDTTAINGVSMRYDYDDVGNRTLVETTRDGVITSSTSYLYDSQNRLEKATDNTGTTTYTYDLVGNLNTVAYPNGLVTDYDYNSVNQLTDVYTRDALGVLISHYNYALSATGRREVISELDGRTTAYCYDSMYRLSEEVIFENPAVAITESCVQDTSAADYVANYQYDWVGNRTYETVNGEQTAYTYDSNDRLEATGGTSYTYDNNGNTLTETLDGVVKTYTWNAKNKLVALDNAGEQSSYTYDYTGIRASKTEAGVTTQFVVDENRDYAQVLEEVVDGEQVVSYSYGHDLLSQDRAGEYRFYHYDGLGSTRALSDGSGVLTDTYDYEAFGEVLGQEGATENSYLFTGEQFDGSLDQYYLRARYYDQGVGRFTSMDTWGGVNAQPITLNKYLYGNADAANNVDPSGHFSIGSQMSAVNIQGTLSTMAVRGASKKALDIARRAKVFNVYTYAQMPVHFYMYVERKGSASGIRYDVGAPGGWGNLGRQLCRGNICGRIPGFVQSSRASRHSLRGVRAKVASFSLGQFMLWHATVMGSEQMECSIDITYSLVPGPNCLSWTISATAKAVAISRLRL